MTNRNINLDVIRIMAILLVFLAHASLTYHENSLMQAVQFGGVGVDLFFILSGWLIGSQIFKEIQTFGNLDLKRFWLRRWFRTMPAYFAVLGATFFQFYLFQKDIHSVFSYLTFTQNYFSDLPYFYVSWSLAVEEQFYIFIGVLLCVSAKINKHIKTILLCLCLISPTLFRLLGWFEHPYESHVRWDCCIAGVLLAQLKFEQTSFWHNVVVKLDRFILIAVGIFISFFVFRIFPPFSGYSDPSPLTLAFIFSFFIIYASNASHEYNKYSKFVVMYISTRSYAIYLLHPEILALSQRINLDINFALYLIVTLLITCLLSECLYRLIELPFMNIREKYTALCSRKKYQQKINTAQAIS
jgi:peptidoglycan/LPS O-acetylase OafA/YrhL